MFFCDNSVLLIVCFVYFTTLELGWAVINIIFTLKV